jgi:hypothetical protein
MRHRLVFSSLPLLVLFLALAPAALASSTWYVDGVNGSDSNNCETRQTACKTIGHAIPLAHSGDFIMVAAATYKENVTIGISLKVIGSGATTTIIDGGGVNTVVTISNANAYVVLSKVTIQNGSAAYGGGIGNLGNLTISHSTLIGNSATGSNHRGGAGGGIDNGGNLTISNSTLSGNLSTGGFDSSGGGVDNHGGLTINSSTLSANGAANGGGIVNSGTLRINNSTLSGNCPGFCLAGGGILNYGTLRINNSTLSGNGAANGGGIFLKAGTAMLQNSIVSNSTHGGNCSGNITSKGYNLSSDNTCNFNGPGDLNNTDPKLGQLGNYGGPTETIPLLSGSPAIDAGNPGGCTDGHGHLLKTDQRGRPRPDKEDTGGCDMGAYECQKD